MKCIIVDNVQSAREELKMNIRELSNLQFVGEFETTDSARDFLQKNSDIDLMFLEVEFPKGMNGLEFLKNLDNPPMTVITTTTPNYAVEAFELDVVDYLLKPVKLDRFIKSVAKVEELTKSEEVSITTDLNEDDFIFIKSERKYIRIKFEDLMFIEGLKDYVIVHATHGRYMTAMNVKTIHNKLPSKIFFRVSKSYIVNINFIDDIDGTFIDIKDNKVPIGRSYRDVFLEFVNRRLLRR